MFRHKLPLSATTADPLRSRGTIGRPRGRSLRPDGVWTAPRGARTEYPGRERSILWYLAVIEKQALYLAATRGYARRSVLFRRKNKRSRTSSAPKPADQGQSTHSARVLIQPL